MHRSLSTNLAEALSGPSHEKKIEIFQGFADQIEKLDATLTCGRAQGTPPGSEKSETFLSLLRRRKSYPSFYSLCENRSDENDKGRRDLDLKVKEHKAMFFDETAIFINWFWLQLLIMQQESRKNIHKAWIKEIYPRKSWKYPYNGGGKVRDSKLRGIRRGDVKRPTWWPKDIPHQKPDYMSRRGNLYLVLTQC